MTGYAGGPLKAELDVVIRQYRALARRAREVGLSASEAVVLPDSPGNLLRRSEAVGLVSAKVFRLRVLVTERGPEPVLQILGEDMQGDQTELLSLKFGRVVGSAPVGGNG